MAVEAHNLNLFPSQYITNRDFMNRNQSNAANMYVQMMESGGGGGGGGGVGGGGGGVGVGVPMAKTMPETVFPFYQSNSIPAKTSVNKSDSGLTYNLPTVPRKRSRDTYEFSNGYVLPQKSNLSSEFSSFLGEDINLQFQQQQLEIDRVIAQHTEKLKMELQERNKRQSRILVSAIQEGIMKELKEKEEEIHRIAKMNWMLTERVKSLFLENQLWRDLAQSNEATANTLRNNLEQVLAHVSEERLSGAGGEREGLPAGPAADDAESCCDNYGNGRKEVEDGEEVEKVGERRMLARVEVGVKDKAVAVVDGGCSGGGVGGNRKMMCKKCGERESCVLLLPCRHLCLCTLCGSTQHTCPVCNTNMTANLHVNLS